MTRAEGAYSLKTAAYYKARIGMGHNRHHGNGRRGGHKR